MSIYDYDKYDDKTGEKFKRKLTPDLLLYSSTSARMRLRTRKRYEINGSPTAMGGYMKLKIQKIADGNLWNTR